MPYRLSAFADEIGPDIQVQMDHLLENGINACAMRGANAKNVMDLEDFQVKLTKTQFHNRGIRFSCIGSPIGKIKITDAFEPEIERMKKAIKLAQAFETKVIRVFTFYIPEGEAASKHQAEVLRRMKAIADLAKAEGINLVVENEKGIYGDVSDRQLEVIEHINSPHVRNAFDFGNYVECKDDVVKAWGKLKKYTVDIHAKDVKLGVGPCPVGEGDGHVREILKDAFATDWKGYITLEPHLSAGGKFSGFTGAALFKTAVDALKKILAEVGAK